MTKRAASVAPIQIRPRRVKRPRRVLDNPPRRPCEEEEAQIQARGRRLVLRTCSSTARTFPSFSPSWGSKRVRTTALRTTTRRRDWSNLGVEGPASLIAERLLANDVADFLRFRAACRPWRLCSVDPRSSPSGGVDGRFLPRQWIMLDTAARHCCRFLNVSTGECIRTDLPELANHMLLATTPEGLLLLLHKPDLVARLLNPLTRQLSDLPPITDLLTSRMQRAWRSGEEIAHTIRVDGIGLALADASILPTVVICIKPQMTAIAKPGDECWTVIDNNRYICSALTFAGRFYCAVGRTVLVLDNAPSDQGPPRLLSAAQAHRSKPPYFSRMSGSIHLVDNGGELMLVHRKLSRTNDTQKAARWKMDYEVYKVDLEARDLVLVKSLGGRAVFTGLRRSISLLPSEAFPSVSANTLFGIRL